MVEFTPRPFTENVNISKVSPKREFFVLFSSLLGILVACYFILGAALNILVDKAPAKVEQVVGKLFQFKKFQTPEKFFAAQQEAQRLLDGLVAFLPDTSQTYTIHIIEEEDINAFAMPGGHIALFSGLLSEVESENELAMILGHELGHHAHRDHLRALGRGIVFAVGASMIFGTDSGVVDAVGGVLSTAEMKFSRKQEAAADQFGLELINKKYGHVAGATDFFQRMEKKRDLPKFLAFFLTHPVDGKRVDMINDVIFDLNYAIEGKVPLGAVFEEQFQKKEESL